MNDNGQINELAIRTSAAFQALTMIAFSLEKRGIISRADPQGGVSNVLPVGSAVVAGITMIRAA